MRIESWLAESEQLVQLAAFESRCIHAKITNGRICAKHRIGHGGFKLTPQEELYIEYFNSEKEFVKDMDDLTLAAHVQELGKVASEAKVRFYSASEAAKDRAKKKGSKGFITSVATDDITTDAINKVKVRKDRMTKIDKAIESLVSAGIDRDAAEKLVSAGTLKAHLDKTFGAEKAAAISETPKPASNFSSPFEKKVETETTVTIIEETIVIKQETEKPKASFNPFE